MSTVTSRAFRPLRALVLGAPGAGKGTQTSRVLKDFEHVASLSSGDILRRNVAEKTEVGKQVAHIMEKGGLVSDNTIVELIKKELQTHNWLNREASWLLDGFPRTAAQAVPLDATLKEYNTDLNLVVELKVPEEVILDRIENRFVHWSSGRVYNLTFNPPKVPGMDDVTSEPLTKRPDDNPEVFKQRLAKYHEATMPLLEYYDKKGILYTIEGETSDIIYPKLKQLIYDQFSR